MQYSINSILSILRPHQTAIRFDDSIEYILTDSRSLSHIQHTLFVALLGEAGDGHNYIGQLYQHGIRNFVIINGIEDLQIEYPEANFIAVTDTLKALQDLAQAWRAKFTLPVIGITGSNGKTIVKEFLHQLLADKFSIVRSPKSYNSQLGVPLSVLELHSSHNLAIFEAGISKPREMERLANIINPTIGIITNIGSAHQENFNNTAQKIDEKLLLFKNCNRIIYNMDDLAISEGLSRAGLMGKARGWSRLNPEATLLVKKIEKNESSSSIFFSFSDEEHSITIPFVDDASIHDVLHCIVALMLLFPSFTEEKGRFANLEAVEMRLEVKEGNFQNTIINDACSNDLISLDIALDFQQRRYANTYDKKVVILSEIEQSGLSSRQLYSNIATLLSTKKPQLVIAVGKEMTRLLDYCPELNIQCFRTTEDVLQSDILTSLSNSCILIKGARTFQFEKIADFLSKKVHQTTLQVNLEALSQNLKVYKSLIDKKTAIIGMIKANAYGAGSYEVAKTLDEAHIDALAVAVADEGKELRQAGILSPIMVMNPEESAFDTLINYKLEPVIFSQSILQLFLEKIRKQGFSRIALHIEVDTGMHRLGFSPEELNELIPILKDQQLVYIKSIFTHLASADNPNEDTFTQQQIEIFEKVAQEFSQKLAYSPLLHILNTAGIERFPKKSLDMVRLGIGLYGISPCNLPSVENVLRLRTTLLQKRKINSGETIGYNRKGLLSNGGNIGIIPIGYADGYDRRFSQGKGWVSIRGKKCPIIGNVCMDTCMIDLSSCPEAQENDEVILWGDSITPISELAQAIDTIPYELIADLSPRVQRVYYKS